MTGKKRALISVSDKTGVAEFARGLAALGYEIVSTGGTLAALQKAGVGCISVSDITGFPECLDGRVKTLHPAVHAGLLAARDDPKHMEQLKKLGIDTIDVVAVNLYPFKKTVEKPGVPLAEAVENIDIGGPTMLRAAAKNYKGVYVVVDPADYAIVLAELAGEPPAEEAERTRFRLMYKVFRHTAAYDTVIANYMGNLLGDTFPESVTFAYEKAQDLRYGENPHQNAVFYRELFPVAGALTGAVQLHGKELSYNNINDTNGALELLREFDTPCAVAVKHANPCGVGLGKSIYEAYCNAYNADTVSVFGGIVAVNGTVEADTAAEINKIFIEIVAAKDFTPEALEILTKKKNIRLLRLDGINAKRAGGVTDMKKVVGGLLVQEADAGLYDGEPRVVTKRAPTEAELKQLAFAYKIVKHTKSNAVVLVNGGASAGIGAGQTNRIWAARQAIEHAGEKAKGSVLASDAFFPFPDCAEAAAAAGVTAIVQPGGSQNDALSVEVCDKYGIAMVFCGMRHFKH
jgi:phosphoribosylaminoimidazolecarboxamide formyltransferase/IMP cyclohydrolase